MRCYIPAKHTRRTPRTGPPYLHIHWPEGGRGGVLPGPRAAGWGRNLVTPRLQPGQAGTGPPPWIGRRGWRGVVMFLGTRIPHPTRRLGGGNLLGRLGLGVGLGVGVGRLGGGLGLGLDVVVGRDDVGAHGDE